MATSIATFQAILEIIVLKQRQISGMHISKLLKVPKSTVFDAIKRFEELGDYNCFGTKKSVHTKNLKNCISTASFMVWVAFSKTWKLPLIFIVLKSMQNLRCQCSKTFSSDTLQGKSSLFWKGQLAERVKNLRHSFFFFFFCLHKKD